jgi:hypothetical protein
MNDHSNIIKMLLDILQPLTTNNWKELWPFFNYLIKSKSKEINKDIVNISLEQTWKCLQSDRVSKMERFHLHIAKPKEWCNTLLK